MESRNGQGLFLGEFSLARAAELLLIVAHTRDAGGLIGGGVTGAPEDICEGLKGIGDVGKAVGVGTKHVEEGFAGGIEEGEGTTAAKVDVVCERGEELLAGA
jgi:uncharacterized membrane protein